MSNNFNGFSEGATDFFTDLRQNNNKNWFEQNRDRFEDLVLTPARNFVIDLGNAVKKFSPEIQAIPKTDKSIFRIHRDIRFSKDKSPYKTHLGIFFWEGERKKLECPGYYFHFEPPTIMIGAGLYGFPKDIQPLFRENLFVKKKGAEFTRVVENIEAKKNYSLGGESFKKKPQGFPHDHKNSRFLLFGGIYSSFQTTIPPEFYSKDLVEYCSKVFKDMSPLHTWLVSIL